MKVLKAGGTSSSGTIDSSGSWTWSSPNTGKILAIVTSSYIDSPKTGNWRNTSAISTFSNGIPITSSFTCYSTGGNIYGLMYADWNGSYPVFGSFAILTNTSLTVSNVNGVNNFEGVQFSFVVYEVE